MSEERITTPREERHGALHDPGRPAASSTEQTVSRLARALRRAGFRADFVADEQARALYHRPARVPALSRLGIADVRGHGRR